MTDFLLSQKWSSRSRPDIFDETKLSKFHTKNQIEILQAKTHSPPYVQKKVLAKNDEEKENIWNFYLKENPYARLHHPNILYFYSSKKQNNIFSFNYEYCDITLSEYLSINKSKIFTEKEIQLFVQQILNAMNIIENIRKVKCCILNPDSIFLNTNAKYLIPKIKYFSANFILSKKLNNEDFMYLAPELLLRSFTIKYNEIPSSNMFWALGLIVFEMFYGYHPFCKEKSNKKEKKDAFDIAISKGVYVIPESRVVSLELISFIHGLLCEDPNKRINWKDVMQQPFLINSVSKFNYCDLNKNELGKMVLNIKKQDSVVMFLMEKFKNKINKDNLSISMISSSSELI